MQGNTRKHCQYRNFDHDDDDNDLEMTRNDEDNSDAVDGDAPLLLLNSAGQITAIASKQSSS